MDGGIELVTYACCAAADMDEFSGGPETLFENSGLDGRR